MNATSNQQPMKKAVAPPNVQAVASVTVPVRPAPKPQRIASVGIPWLPTNGYLPRYIEGSLKLRQRIALALIHQGIVESGVRVRSHTDALRLVLDKIADEIGIGPTGEYPGKPR